jgi:DNA-binding CsgD family transcriptional regulator
MAAPTDIFVGRLRELDTLRDALDHSITGHGRIVMLAGEPGIGKTRTAQELAHHAQKHGATVLWGHCHEEAGAPPYWPWVQIIRGTLRTAKPGALLSDVGTDAIDIVDIVPEIRDLVPGLEPSVRLEDAAQARFRMFESIRQLFASLAARQTALVVLENLHWADAPSLRLLEFLAPEIADSRLLLLGTYRPTELSRQHPLSDALGELARASHATRIHLAGLSAEETHDFVAAATGARPPAWLAASLHAQTEGNPLFLREIVRFLQQQGVLGVDRATPLTALPPAIRIPEGVREVIGRRLNLLSASCNEVLALAAVIGREFGHDVLLQAAAERSEQGLIEALEEALGAHVIEETTDGQYQFTHNLIRMTLYDELRTPRRRQLHRVVGNALEELRRADLDGAMPELTRHFLAAGDIDTAIRYAIRAGQHAEEALAFEDAVQFFQVALDAMEQRFEQDDNERCRLLFLLGEAQRKSGVFPLAQATLREAAEIARKLELYDILAFAALAYERTAWRVERPPELGPEHFLADALRLVPEAEIALRVELMGGLARRLLHAGVVDKAREQLAEAIAIARQIHDPGLLATSLNYLFDFPSQPSDTLEWLARATETLEAAQQADNVELVALAHSRRLVCSLELGDMQAVEDELGHLAHVDARIRQPIYWTVLLGFRATLALLRGELGEAERLLSQAMARLARMGSSQKDYLSVLVFCLRREQGRLNELQAALTLFIRQTAASATWRPGLMILYLELDRVADARTEFEHLAAHNFADIPRDGRWTTCIVYLAEVCAVLGDTTRAEVLYRLLLPYAERVILLGGGAACAGAAGRYLGLLCATMRRWPQAQQHFEAAMAMNRAIGARVPLAHTQYDYATMLCARAAVGDREDAIALLQESLATARALGMHALEQRAAARLAQLPAVTTARDDLTSREVEVLGLMAIGRSNADIAMVLAISLNTVATHVRNILAKTGCANRTEAAAYAMRHGVAGAGVHT